ncbi:Arsenate reductase [Tenacibaculum sp. 190130A14a]|uniref:Arsenate reductase n=1 Tax=Tenacibaculum polynesiense TaxID=3137857 RepID=A0ABP1F1B4_9FLAO
MMQTKTTNPILFFEEAKKGTFISTDRINLLHNIAKTFFHAFDDRNKLNINFICTHNSRRSQIAQVWSFLATEYFELENIFSFSGGTEVTAFHRNTVRTLQEVGFEFNVIDFSHQNPKYLITFNKTKKSIIGYSKVYDDSENNFPYIAITTCDSADENCPFIPDAIERFHLPFIDPKTSDNTPLTSETYLKTNQQIAAEVFIIFKEFKTLLEQN